MAPKVRKCPFCSKTNKLDSALCTNCEKYIIDINQNSPGEITALCQRYIDEKLTNPRNIGYIQPYMDKLKIDGSYYREYLDSKLKIVSRKNRVHGLGKLGLGLLLLAAGIIQCLMPIIWVWPMFFCLIAGAWFIFNGSGTLISGNK